MSVKQLDPTNFKEEIKNEITVVDFWAPWCGPCQMMGPIFEELSSEIKDIKFAKLNTQDYQELASENNITGIPCLIIFKDGKEINRIVGFAPKDVMKQKIIQASGI